jgi:DNA-binding SARP family transcriptional activator
VTVHRLYLLGTPQLEDPAGNRVAGIVVQPKILALLGYLACGQAPRRDAILALLWPEHDTARGRHGLRQALFELRRHLGDHALEGRRAEQIAVATGALWCDVVEFRAARARDDHAAALALYRGPLFDGFHVSGAPDFERWIDDERALLAQDALTSATIQSERCEGAGDLPAALDWAVRAADDAPYHEPAWERRARLLVTLGDRAGALAVYDRFAARLRADLALEPSPRFQQVLERARTAGPAALRLTPGPGAAPAAAIPSAAGPGRARRSRLRPFVAAALVLAAASWGIGPFSATTHPAPTRLLLADFSAQPGERSLAAALAAAVDVDLRQSPRVEIMSPELRRATRERMRQDLTTPLTPEAAREVALRDGYAVVLDGDVARVGPGYLLSATLIAAGTGEAIAAVREDAPDSSALLGAVERLSRDVRRRLGESTRSLHASAPLPTVTTASLEALRLFAEAGNENQGPERAMALLREAIAIDSTFATARWRLAAIDAAWGSGREAHDQVGAAYRLRAHLPYSERMDVEAHYARDFEHDDLKARALLEQALQVDPGDGEALTILTDIYMHHHDYTRAESYARRGVSTGHRFVDYYNLVVVQVAQGKFIAADSSVDGLAADVPGHLFVWRLRGEICAARHDWACAERLLEVYRDSAQARDSRFDKAGALVELSDAADADGRPDDAVRFVREDLRDPGRMPPRFLRWRSIHLGLLGLRHRADTAAAVALLDRIYRPVPPADIPPDLATDYLEAGRVERAREIVEVTRARGDTGRGWQAAAAELDARTGRSEQAIARWRRYIEGNPAECTSCGLYQLADAWDRAGNPDSARVWFQRALGSPGLRNLQVEDRWMAHARRRLAELALLPRR